MKYREILYFKEKNSKLRLEIPGTMEAACESGERVARAILKTFMASLSCPKQSQAIYRPRRPEKTVLHEVTKKHFSTWHRNYENTTQKQVPSYIDNAFQKYLGCGILAKGFACAHCEGCHKDLIIPVTFAKTIHFVELSSAAFGHFFLEKIIIPSITSNTVDGIFLVTTTHLSFSLFDDLFKSFNCGHPITRFPLMPLIVFFIFFCVHVLMLQLIYSGQDDKSPYQQALKVVMQHD